MKILLPLIILPLVSCTTDIKNWDTPDPNKNANIASDISDPRHYSSDSIGKERQGMTDQEIRKMTEPKKEKRLSGELSFGVGRSF